MNVDQFDHINKVIGYALFASIIITGILLYLNKKSFFNISSSFRN